MQIPILAQLLFFLSLYSLSYFSRKNSQNNHVVRKAKKAKPVN